VCVAYTHTLSLSLSSPLLPLKLAKDPGVNELVAARPLTGTSLYTTFGCELCVSALVCTLSTSIGALSYLAHQQKSTFLIPSYSILLHLIPLILGVRRE